jgi:cytoskeletal protein RodZ
MVFVMRKLDRVPQTLGEKLRALRRGQAVTLDLMEQETHIQRRYLEALEWGQYQNLPEPLYTRNFIRAYARVLNADANYFIELYEEEVGRCDLVDHLRLPRQRVRGGKFFVWSKVWKFGALGLVALSFFGYLGWQITAITAPPRVVLNNPEDSSITYNAIINVTGQVDDETNVYIDGEEVVVNADRTFSAPVDLEKGLNVIRVEARRRYSRTAVIDRRVVFDPQVTETVTYAP